jgi:hypothetical protein
MLPSAYAGKRVGGAGRSAYGADGSVLKMDEPGAAIERWSTRYGSARWQRCVSSTIAGPGQGRLSAAGGAGHQQRVRRRRA